MNRLLNRRGAFLSILSAVGLFGQKKQQKWYITGGYTENGRRDDCAVPPLVSHGANILEAVKNSGITVWTAEEYESIREGFQKACKS